MRRLRLSRFLWIPVILILVGTASGLALWLASGPDDWKGLGLNLATELVGAAVTYILLVLILERTEDIRSEKERIIAELGSTVNDVAVAAAEKLRQRGWLSDGSLRGANLRRTNLGRAYLRWAYLKEADLRWADLSEANLRGVDLSQASLVKAHLRGANLRGAILMNADLSEADLSEADLDKTTLPDGDQWTPDTDLTRFTDPDHPEFWRSDDPDSPAYRGKDGD